MINNIKNLFSKYIDKINSRKEIEEKIIFYFQNELKLNLDKNNLIIDIKKKEIRIINIKSSINFFINNNITKDKMISFKKETGFELKLIR